MLSLSLIKHHAMKT